jgi:hypothetical protein
VYLVVNGLWRSGICCFAPNCEQAQTRTGLRSQRCIATMMIRFLSYSKSGMQKALATKFCTGAPNICGSSVWNLRSVLLLTPGRFETDKNHHYHHDCYLTDRKKSHLAIAVYRCSLYESIGYQFNQRNFQPCKK